MPLQLVTLGELKLEGAGFQRIKPLLLLTYVTLEGRRDRRHLAELFWPRAANPLNSLAASLKQIRAHAPAAVQTTPTHVASTVACDAHTFLEASNAESDQRALDVYKGTFLHGVSLQGWSDELEEWVYSTREILAARARRSLLTVGGALAAAGQFGQAARYAEQAYLLPGAGQMELGELRSAYTLLSAGNSSLVGRIRRDALDIGVRLDLSGEEARGAFSGDPRVATRTDASWQVQTSAVSIHRVPSTSFVGREVELQRLENLFLRSDCRLLTLTGTGGIGKTRLALQAAEALKDKYRDGVVFVPLDSLRYPESMPQHLATTLNLAPSSAEPPWVQLKRYLADKAMLLVLDNFEHFLESTSFITVLLRDHPELRLLVTSRERLDLDEEWVISLAGLTYPERDVAPREALDYGAMKLLVDRIERVSPAFMWTDEELPLLLKLCRLVDGLPLALELAASWLRAQSLEQLVRTLETNLDMLLTTSQRVPERHRSMRATFDSAWYLLSRDGQQALTKLSVFRGGFRDEAAAYVADVSLATLVSLIDKSLLSVQPAGRYRFHPLLRRYCQEKLAVQEQTRAHIYERYKEFHLNLIFEIASLLDGPEHPAGLKRLQEEQDNIRELLKVAEASADVELGLLLADKLRTFWTSQGHDYELLSDVVRQVKMFGNKEVSLPTLLRIGPGTAIPMLAGDEIVPIEPASQNGVDDQRPSEVEEAHEPAGKLVIEALEARAFGNYQLATTLLRKRLTQQRLQNDRRPIAQNGVGLTLTRLALVLCEQGKYAEAATLYEESLTLHRSLSELEGVAISLLGMSDIHREQRDAASLYTLCTECRDIFQSLNETWGVGYSLNSLALGAYIEGDFDRSIGTASEAIALFHAIKYSAPTVEAFLTIGWAALAQDNIRQARQAFAQSLALGWDHAPRWLQANLIEGLAGVAVGETHPKIAVQLLSTARTLRENMGIPSSPLRQSMVEPIESATRGALTPEEWLEANEGGQEFPVDSLTLFFKADDNLKTSSSIFKSSSQRFTDPASEKW